MGLDNWIDIFKGGSQVDSQGREHDGDELIAKATASYNPEQHEAPVVVGHPQDNAPAYGWVEALRELVRDGTKYLQAKLKQVEPAFADLVEQGRFKQRSAAFYPDGSLRHVGFLGAMPPAVKGLKAIDFKAEEKEFNEFTQEEKNMDKEKELAAAKELAASELAQEKAKNEALSKEFAEFKALTNREKLNAYLEKLSDQGLILPYQQPGLLNFMEVLSESGQEQVLLKVLKK